METVANESFTRADLQQITKLTVQFENIMSHLHKMNATIEQIELNQHKQEIDIQELKRQITDLSDKTPNHTNYSSITRFITKNWYYLLALCGSGVVGWIIDRLYYLHHIN